MNNIDILEEMIKPIATRTFLFSDGRKEEKEIYNLERKQIEAIETLIAKNKELKEEIEELKENNGYHLGFIDGGIAKRYEYEYKIKAKIEEVEQWGLYNMKIPKLSTLDERLGTKIGIKYVLQSLLGKE